MNGVSTLNNISPWTATTQLAANQQQRLADNAEQLQQPSESQKELREVFDKFVGQSFYSQLLSAMRQTVGRPAYFHGGRAEEVFQAQLDQLLSERLSDAGAESFTEPMFELFNLNRT